MNYMQPGSLAELNELLPALPERTAILAGGTDLMPKLRAKRPELDGMLSLCQVPELREIRTEEGWLKLGAMVTHAAAAGDGTVGRYFQALQMACSHVGSQQIRNKGTLGGSLANASPAGDIMPCVFLYGGQVELLGPEGSRRLPVEEYLGPDGRTALGRNELLTALWLPVVPELHSCFVKLGSRTEVTIAQISMCAAWRQRPEGPELLRAWTGAIDRRPVPFPAPELLARAETAEQAAEVLAGEIRRLRQSRSRPSRLKLTQDEQLYKERAAKGVIYDLMEQISSVSPMS